jgi:hypothetical protein
MRLATKPPRASGASIRLSTPAALRTEIHRGRMPTTTGDGKSESRPAQGVCRRKRTRGQGWPMGRAACTGPAGKHDTSLCSEISYAKPAKRQAFSPSGQRVTYSESERVLRAADRRRERRAGKRAAASRVRKETFEALALGREQWAGGAGAAC